MRRQSHLIESAIYVVSYQHMAENLKVGSGMARGRPCIYNKSRIIYIIIILDMRSIERERENLLDIHFSTKTPYAHAVTNN